MKIFIGGINMCAGLEQCCVSCLLLLTLTYITAAAPWTKINKQDDLMEKDDWEKMMMMQRLKFNSRVKYVSQDDDGIEELESAEIETAPETDNTQKANKTKFTPTNPDPDSDNFKEDDFTDAESDMESLSVVWYLGAFGGLVTFFLVIVCSEFCFGNAMYRRHNPNEYINRVNVYADAYFPQTPPPPYHLFAPPAYTDTLQKKFQDEKAPMDKTNSFEKDSFNKSQIYIIPVHQSKIPYPPPSYTA